MDISRYLAALILIPQKQTLAKGFGCKSLSLSPSEIVPGNTEGGGGGGSSTGKGAKPSRTPMSRSLQWATGASSPWDLVRDHVDPTSEVLLAE